MVSFTTNKKTPPRKARSENDYSPIHQIWNIPTEFDTGLL
jgi:hypothetical protein